MAVLAVALGSLGLAGQSYAAPAPVTFSVDWSAACTQCQAPIVAAGTAFTTDHPGGSAIPYRATVRTFVTATGRPLWTHKVGKVESARVGAVGAGVAYVIANRPDAPGKVLALDAANGNVLWSATPLHTTSGVTGVALDGTGVFVVSGASDSPTMIVARYDTSGARVWTRRQARSAGDFVAGGGNLYVFSSTFTPPDTQRDVLNLYREADGSGTVAWRQDGLASLPPHDVAVEDGLVYAVEYTPGEGSGFGTIAIFPGSGDTLWNDTHGATDLAVGPDVAISGTSRDGGGITGLDARTGAVLWGPIGGTGGNPVIVNAAFYTSDGNTVYAHSPATGRVRGSYVSEAQDFLDLGVAGGHVYAAGTTQLVSLTPHAS
jgi:hypothetical protein